jgi:DNA primase
MGKAYIDTVKYVVHANVEIDGVVEKPDVVGAIFGQTEGLLGDELDLRELQKSGRIGRIEVDLKGQGGRSNGIILLPSSLDRVETAILGAALETVDRVGPCEAKINIARIEDTRTMKRTQVVNRAKDILKTMITDVVPESKEISELVREEVKTAEVSFFGPEKLPCGPGIAEADHVIIVEGRADVLNMLKCDIKNVVSLQGKNVPKSVADLTREKTVTVFVDGDRGGDLIIKTMSEIAEVDFVAKAPDGKEVEELTKKEVIKCLRSKIPMEQFMSRTFREYVPREREQPQRQQHQQQRFQPREQPRQAFAPRDFQSPSAGEKQQREFQPREQREAQREFAPREPALLEAAPVASPARLPEKPRIEPPFDKTLKTLEGSLKAVLLDRGLQPVSEVDVKDLARELENRTDIQAAVFDGIITQRLVDLANERGVKYLVAVKQSKIENKGNVTTMSLS